MDGIHEGCPITMQKNNTSTRTHASCVMRHASCVRSNATQVSLLHLSSPQSKRHPCSSSTMMIMMVLCYLCVLTSLNPRRYAPPPLFHLLMSLSPWSHCGSLLIAHTFMPCILFFVVLLSSFSCSRCSQ